MAATANIQELDRRKRSRYPISAAVRHRLLSEGDKTEYPGEVANMNSFSVYVRSAERPERGKWVHASIEWPVLLDGRIPLQFVCSGVVSRVDDDGFAFEFHKHEFKTKRTISISEGRKPQREMSLVARMA
jgi:hypothetical protein